MKSFIHLLIIGFLFIIIYNLLPSREGLTEGGAIIQAAAQQAAGEASIAKSLQELAHDPLENRGDYANPLVVSVQVGGGGGGGSGVACPKPTTCGGVACTQPNCLCTGNPPQCSPGGGIPGCPPCCPPCKTGSSCPTPIVCGGVTCAQPNCVCSGDPPTCKPGGCAGCAPPPGNDPLNKHYNNLNAKESAQQAQCKANAAQIKANAATLQAFPAKLQAAYAQLKPMASKINANTQYIQDSSGILGAFIKNQVAAAKAAAAKADGIAFGSFGAIPAGVVPKLLWFVDSAIPQGIKRAKEII